MNDTLIVGYGNTLRGDDGLGPYVVGRLGTDSLPTGTRCLCLPQLDISLVEPLPRADVAIFVDARDDDDDALLRVDQIVPPDLSGSSPGMPHTTHAIGLPLLLGLAVQWYGRAPACYLLQPKGVDFSICETLSATAQRSAALAGQAILHLLRAHHS